jgi:hypothetical protein
VRAARRKSAAEPDRPSVGGHPQGQRLDGISLALRKAGTSSTLGVFAALALFCRGTDTLVIVGSRVAVDDERVFIAKEVKKGDSVWTLRDAAGLPLWRGRGGRP